MILITSSVLLDLPARYQSYCITQLGQNEHFFNIFNFCNVCKSAINELTIIIFLQKHRVSCVSLAEV